MPVIIDKTIHSHSRLAVWNISESVEELTGKLILNTDENNFLQSIKTDKKKLQWLASRCLIRTMMNTGDYIAMHTSNTGQPLITNSHKKVSISHAGSHAAVIMSDSLEVGIDIEEVTAKVMRIRHKFIGEAEMEWMEKEINLEKNLLIWSAKESLFKWYAKGDVDFRQNLFLDDFKVGNEGLIKGRFENNTFSKELEIQYEIFNSCVLTWVTG